VNLRARLVDRAGSSPPRLGSPSCSKDLVPRPWCSPGGETSDAVEYGYTVIKMLHQRHYTAEQANALLPEVRVTVRRLQDAKRVLQDEGFDTGFATLADVVGGAFPGLVRAQAAVAATLGFEHLEELDLLVRDLEAGLIDFPALRDGREVYLCWQVDEMEVGHWHAAETGYPSRLPLDPWL
jgi:hypothetical protein